MNILEELVLKHGKALHNFGYSLTNSEEETEDLMQDTWIKCINYQTLLMTMAEAKQRSWLFSVLKNRFLDIRRKQKLQRNILSQAISGCYSSTDNQNWEQYLSLLEPLEKNIVLHRYWLGLNSRQISEKLQIPEGTVRWRLKAALQKIKTNISQSMKEEECLL